MPDTEAISAAKLICLNDSMLPDKQKGILIKLSGSKLITIGRNDDNSVVLKSKSISRYHAKLFPVLKTWCIEDLKSTNGIHINNRKVQNSMLCHGDTVYVGTIPFRYELENPDKDLKNLKEFIETNKKSISDGKTMQVSDHGAINAILEAKDSQKGLNLVDIPKTKNKEKNNRDDSKFKSLNSKESNFKKGINNQNSNTLFKIIAFIVMLIFITVGIFYYVALCIDKREKKIVLGKYQKILKEFSEQSEHLSNTFVEKTYEKELRTLDQFLNDIFTESERFSDNIEIKYLISEALFYRLERGIRYLIGSNDVEAGKKTIEETRQIVCKYASDYKDNIDESVKKIKEIVELIRLLEICMEYKFFQKKYSDPESFKENKIEKELKDNILKLDSQKDEFITLKKNNYSVLMVKFSYFAGMVNEVEEQCFVLIYKWSKIAFAK